MPDCAVCLRETGAGAELTCCDVCGAVAHSGCRNAVEGICPKCSGRFSDELYFAPVTPGFDILVALTGGFAAIAALLFLAAVGGLVYAAKNGVAFFYVVTFYLLPAACLLVVFGGSFALAWYLRGEARRPKRIGA